MSETLSAPAPAKINLALEVLGRRDDGFHEVDTILQTLELSDAVTLAFGGVPGVSASGPFAPGTPCNETNLAWRVAVSLAGRLGRGLESLSIHLEKRIPAAGGLGGGASDAATTLRLLQWAWPEASSEDLTAAAVAAGSDEAFFLVGGTARARGRGEWVTPLPPLPAHDVVIFVPPGTIERKTARMFAALGPLPFDSGSVAEAFSGRPPQGLGASDIYNSFERVAFDLFPELAALWEELEARTGDAIRLAGAGPALFWIGPPGEGRRIAEAAAGAACTVIETATAGGLWKP